MWESVLLFFTDNLGITEKVVKNVLNIYYAH